MSSFIPLLVKEYGSRLQTAGVPNPHVEALQILRQILGNKTSMDPKRKEALEGAFHLRERRMPIERIFGTLDFYGLKIRTELDVFKPYPETEDMVHYAVTTLADEKGSLRVLDLGTGTGCILLAILNALPQASGIGIDISERAVENARENARTNNLSDRAEFRIGNWGEGINEKFDLVITNAPRAPTGDIPFLLPEMRDYDPPHSLDGGADGLNFIRRTAKDFDRLSKDKSLCMCQLGPVYATEVDLIFRDVGFRNTEIKGNYTGQPCCLIVKKGATIVSSDQADNNFWNMMTSWMTAFS